VPFVLIALALMVALDVWIRVRPLDMPRALQLALSVALLVAIAVLLWLVRRVERAGARP
jgi:ABC-type microcin C transport system duplicated ATPase subunit YejF